MKRTCGPFDVGEENASYTYSRSRDGRVLKYMRACVKMRPTGRSGADMNVDIRVTL